jgi:hypothetical protein
LFKAQGDRKGLLIHRTRNEDGTLTGPVRSSPVVGISLNLGFDFFGEERMPQMSQRAE